MEIGVILVMLKNFASQADGSNRSTETPTAANALKMSYEEGTYTPVVYYDSVNRSHIFRTSW